MFVSGTTARPPDLEGNAYAQTKAALAIIAYRKPFYQVLRLEPHQDSVGEPLPPRTGQALSLSEEGSNYRVKILWPFEQLRLLYKATPYRAMLTHAETEDATAKC